MAKSDAEKLLDQQEKDRRKANEEAQKLMDEAVPTPSQRENDLAKLGQQADAAPAPEPAPEADDGDEGTTTRDVEADKPAGYKTRASGKAGA